MTVILAATDLSARSDRALERAFERAKALNARVVVAHVIDAAIPATSVDRLRAEAQTQIEACMRGIVGAAPAEVCIAEGQAYKALLQMAEELDAAAIVVGIHRNANGPDSAVGATVERLVRTGSRPVLMVRDPVAGPYQTALLAVDFSPRSRFALRAALRLAPETTLHAVHAFHAPFEGFHTGSASTRLVEEEHATELSALIEDEVERHERGGAKAGQIIPRTVHGEAYFVLRQAAKDLRPQLMVLGAHGRSGVSRMILGSVAENFLADPPCDVLVVRGR